MPQDDFWRTSRGVQPQWGTPTRRFKNSGPVQLVRPWVMTRASRLCPLKNRSVICVHPHRLRDRRRGQASTKCPSPSSVTARQKDRSSDSRDEEQYRAKATCNRGERDTQMNHDDKTMSHVLGKARGEGVYRSHKRPVAAATTC